MGSRASEHASSWSQHWSHHCGRSSTGNVSACGLSHHNSDKAEMIMLGIYFAHASDKTAQIREGLVVTTPRSCEF